MFFQSIEHIFKKQKKCFHLVQSTKKKIIIVSVGKNYEPFYIEDPKEGYPGFEVEIAKKYADFIGVRLKVIPLDTFGDHADAIRRGLVDVALGNSSSLERGKYVGFSDPYIKSSIGALVNKRALPPEPEGQIVENNPYTNLFDLKYLPRIIFAVKANTSNYKFLKQNFNPDNIYTYLSDQLTLDALLNNKVNCFVSDNLYIEGLLQKNPSLKASYKPLLNTVVEKHLSFATKKYDLIMLNDLNFFVREIIRTGEVTRLKKKYFNSDAWVKR